jgi:hypothetical protein
VLGVLSTVVVPVTVEDTVLVSALESVVTATNPKANSIKNNNLSSFTTT